MQSGVIHLKEILSFVENHKAQDDAFRIDGSTDLGDEYIAKRNDVLSTSVPRIPDKFGFYLWGFYDHKKFWVNVYLGKSGNEVEGKTAHLRYRIREELGDERAFAWRAFCPKDKVISLDPNYPAEVKRAINKAGSTHIFWVAPPNIESQNIEPIENALIETMNPTGNRRRCLPLGDLQQTGEVLESFRGMIHRQENRDSAYRLNYHKEFWKWVGQADPKTP